MIVYKVVSINNKGVFMSACMKHKNIAVRYAVGKTTLPKIRNSKLAAFRTLEDAKDFAHPTQTILKCKAVICRKKIVRRLAISEMWKPRSVIAFWNHPNKVYSWDYAWPDGTVLCDSITPIERIQ